MCWDHHLELQILSIAMALENGGLGQQLAVLWRTASDNTELDDGRSIFLSRTGGRLEIRAGNCQVQDVAEGRIAFLLSSALH